MLIPSPIPIEDPECKLLPEVLVAVLADARFATLAILDEIEDRWGVPHCVDPEQEADVDDDFDHWVATVRDPADRATEGIRTIGSRKMKASAEYQIAPLPDGRYALQYDLQYHSGDCHGRGTPWDAYATREECVNTFLEAAREHFSRPVGESQSVWEDDVRDGYRGQRVAQKKILALLKGEGLFGFIEPEPTPVPDWMKDDDDEE